MKILKNLLMLILAVSLMFTLVACNSDSDTDKTVDETTDVTTVADETTTAPEDDKVTYTVTLVDESGAPIAGAMVSFCDDHNCKPGLTNESGVATFSENEGEYKVCVSNAQGYEYDPTEYTYFEDGSCEMTITLKAAA